MPAPAASRISSRRSNDKRLSRIEGKLLVPSFLPNGRAEQRQFVCVPRATGFFVSRTTTIALVLWDLNVYP
jgi:hypothetical protein